MAVAAHWPLGVGGSCVYESEPASRGSRSVRMDNSSHDRLLIFGTNVLLMKLVGPLLVPPPDI